MGSTYILAQLTIHDRARYAAQFLRTLAPYAGRLLAAREPPEVLAGEWPYTKVVLLEFRDRDEAQRWLHSSEYRRIAADREASTRATLLAFEGLHPWHPPTASGTGTR